jgi:hypothetical protein
MKFVVSRLRSMFKCVLIKHGCLIKNNLLIVHSIDRTKGWLAGPNDEHEHLCDGFEKVLERVLSACNVHSDRSSFYILTFTKQT